MRIIILLFIFLLIPVNILADIIITEVQVRGESPDESYITIFNQGDSDINISKFKLRKRSSTGKESSIRVFPYESIILSKGYFKWANSRNNHHLDIEADVWSTAGISANNSIALLSPENKIIDSLSWGSGKSQFLLGPSLAQNPENHQIIKRISSMSGYQNTKDNYKDFQLDPEIDLNIPESKFIETQIKIDQSNTSPITSGVGIAVLSALSILILKKSLKE